MDVQSILTKRARAQIVLYAKSRAQNARCAKSPAVSASREKAVKPDRSARRNRARRGRSTTKNSMSSFSRRVRRLSTLRCAPICQSGASLRSNENVTSVDHANRASIGGVTSVDHVNRASIGGVTTEDPSIASKDRVLIGPIARSEATVANAEMAARDSVDARDSRHQNAKGRRSGSCTRRPTRRLRLRKHSNPMGKRPSRSPVLDVNRAAR